MAYCTRDNVYQLALPATAFVSRARPFDAVGASTATIRLKAHGLSTLDIVTFEKTSGGTLPTGISEFTVYYPVPVSSDLFRLATSYGGTPIASWVSGGSGWAIAVDPGRRLDMHVRESASRIDDHLTAHELPLLPDNNGEYPYVLVGLNARMAARQCITTLQFDTTAFRTAIDRLAAQEKADEQMLLDWKNGKPLQPRPEDSDSIPDNAAQAYAVTPMDWLTGTL